MLVASSVIASVVVAPVVVASCFAVLLALCAVKNLVDVNVCASSMVASM